MSKKLNDAQQNYRTFECETLAIIKALLKWEDKLLGFGFMIVTDHKVLGYLNTQWKLLSRQIRWIDYMSWINAKIIYARGSENRLADCLSHYYEKEEGNGTSNEKIDWANADLWLDPKRNDLPHDRWLEMKVITIEEELNPQKSKHLVEKRETWILEAQEMAPAAESTAEEAPHTNMKENLTVLKSAGTLQEPLVEYGINPNFLMLSARGTMKSHCWEK